WGPGPDTTTNARSRKRRRHPPCPAFPSRHRRQRGMESIRPARYEPPTAAVSRAEGFHTAMGSPPPWPARDCPMMPNRTKPLLAPLTPPAALLPHPPAVAGAPSWLPRYDVTIALDVAGRRACVQMLATWTNRHQTPATELVFNAHSRYVVPDADVGF